MMRRVVDTNVPIVANGRNTTASIDCRLAAVEFLHSLIEDGQTVLDLGGQIQAEYHTYLYPSGEPGVGDLFYLMVLNSAPKSIVRIDLPIDPLTSEFLDFPDDPELGDFDPSDRKFVAAVRKANVPIANAIDSDWLDYILPLNENGIAVEFICGCDQTKWNMEA